MMTDKSNAVRFAPTNRLANSLVQEALDASEHPADAVSALMSAAATILQRSFGAEEAIRLMMKALTDTRDQLPQGVPH